RRNVVEKLREQGVDLDLTDEQASRALERLKLRESKGSAFESAEASFELLVRRTLDGYQAPFMLEDFLIVERRRHAEPGVPTEDASSGDRGSMMAEAMVKLRIGEQMVQVAADGNGPVSALDAAVRKALVQVFPSIEPVHLVDYKVRIINSQAGSDAAVRTLIETSD